MKPRLGTSGRLSVSLSVGGKERTFDVHTLVAEAFLGPRPVGLEINHIDGVATNNRSDNLEYCTRRENMRHAYRLGLSKELGFGVDHHLAKLTMDQVRIIRACNASVSDYLLARVFSVSRPTINKVRKGLTWDLAMKLAIEEQAP